MSNEIIVDNILWVFIQNVINLPYEYLQETEEYTIFEESQLKENILYKLSKKEIYDFNEITYNSNIIAFNNEYYTFTNFFEMLLELYDIFIHKNKTDSIKFNLLNKAIPIMQQISLENKLKSMTL